LDVSGRLTAFRSAFFDLTDPISTARDEDRDDDAIDARSLGSSLGVEVSLRRPLTRRVGGLVSYTLSRNVRSFERTRTVAAFDRTHVLNAALSYDLGRRWRAGTRLIFYTGVPATPLRDSDDYPQSAGRTRPFSRLDLRLEKRWTIAERVWLALVLELFNSFAHREVIDVECDEDGCRQRTIGPITVPSIGVEGGF
jgi:hypothetical protein